MPDDAQLLRQYLEEHSQTALNELVKRHLNLVYFAALRQNGGDAHGANDISQKVFLRLISKAHVLADRSSLAGWLFTTTRFEASHAARTERRRLARERASQAMNDRLGGSDVPADWERLRPVIDDVLHGLNDRDREVVLLRFFQGSAFASIGQRLGLSEDAARLRLQRALLKMRALLVKRGIDSSSAALTLALASQVAAAAPAETLAAVIKISVLPAAPVPPMLKLFQIMTTTKAFIGISAAVSLLLLSFSAHERFIAIRAQKAISAEELSYKTELTRLSSLAKRAQSERENAASLQLAVEKSERHLHPGPARAAGHSAVKGGSASVPRPPKPGPTNRELSQNPVFRQAFSAWVKANLAVYDGPLFKALNLSPEQINAFDDLIYQVDHPLGNQAVTLRPDDVTPLQIQQQIHQLLGDAGYQQYVQASQSQYVRSVANGLAGNLYYTETPLTSQQADQLTQALVSTAPPGPAVFPGMVNWPATVALAEGILSPSQLAVFQKEASILSSQPGLWSGIPALSLLTPGAYASGNAPPAPTLAIQGARQ